jgi:hypothetical protein
MTRQLGFRTAIGTIGGLHSSDGETRLKNNEAIVRVNGRRVGMATPVLRGWSSDEPGADALRAGLTTGA